ncbi:MAG: 3-phosphoshikimate 1-carboxyvinyltransferase [Verrucomicrobia bacterium]|nr:MAG: 3-phosphoshikimate 1-carboxyvinyltransferase [Verrucomicrobiota bacterium]
MSGDLLWIPPFTAPARGIVRLPGSKSITNRAMLLAALAEGETTLEGALFSEDTAIMADGLRRLGFTVEEDAGARRIRVHGTGGRIPAAEAELFVGLAGTAARFLTALCCLHPGGRYRIDGVPQMRKRPIGSLLDALENLGARIHSNGGFFPIDIESRGLAGGTVSLDASSSSQLLSALLMVAPLARAPVTIELTNSGYRREYVRMTLRMMEQFGQAPARISADAMTLHPPHGAPYRRATPLYPVEPDASAASYFLALPIAAGGGITLPGLPEDSLQGDTGFADRLAEAGVRVSRNRDGVTSTFSRGERARAADADYHPISDTFLTMAALAPLLDGVTRIRGIAHTRRQETDRVAGMAAELRRLGQHVIEEKDALEIHPRPLRAGVEIETYGDHRFAMSFGILGCHDLRGDGHPWLAIRNPGCCAKTFPDFFEVLESVRRQSLQSDPHE